MSEKKQTEELIVLEEIKYPVTEDKIKAFVDKYKVITELNADVGLKDPGYKAMKKAHLEAVTFRTGIEKTRKVLVSPALAYNKKVNKLAKEYTEMLEATELLLFGERHKVELYEQEQEQKRITAERVRVDNIDAEITKLREIPLTILGKTAKEVEAVYDHVLVPTIEMFQERHEEAINVYKDSMGKLEAQILAMRKSEEADKIIAEEKKKNDEAKAKVEAEIKADREQFERDKAQLKKEREDLEREKREKIETENRAKAEKEAEEMAESERIAKEANEQADKDKAIAKRQAEDQAHKVWEGEALDAIQYVIDNDDSDQYARAILEAIITEQIPHVKWEV